MAKEIISINKDGFIERMEQLKADGYKLIWSGNGMMCFGKEMK